MNMDNINTDDRQVEDVKTTDAEETKTDIANDANTETKDYAAEARNKAIALQNEREEKRKILEELEQYKKLEAKAIEDDKKKKGKYEELLQEKEQALAELQAKIDSLSPIAEKHNAMMQKQLEDLQNKIPDAKKDFVSKLVDGKDFDTQVEILTEMSKQF